MNINRKAKAIVALILSIITIITLSSETMGAVINNLSSDGISWGGTKVGLFEIDGRPAFCIDHSKTTPGSGIEYSSEIYNDAYVRKIL